MNRSIQSTESGKVLNKILQFFAKLQLHCQMTTLQEPTFLPGVKIVAGGLLIDIDKLTHVGDLLHEAGHIAVTPAADRHRLTGDMKYAGHTGGDEMASIAWSWAALKYLDLPPELVFHADGYGGGSANYIEAFQAQGGFGHPLLAYYGMCQAADKEDGFPLMLQWLRG